jgi:hypothetical protein
MGVLRMWVLRVPIKGVLSNKKIFSIRNFSLKIVYFVIKKNLTILHWYIIHISAHYISSRTKPPLTNKLNVRIKNKETLKFYFNI